ncbi:hypothetical protein [Thiolapillus sp.]
MILFYPLSPTLFPCRGEGEQNQVGRAKRSVPDNGARVGHGLTAFAQPTGWGEGERNQAAFAGFRNAKHMVRHFHTKAQPVPGWRASEARDGRREHTWMHLLRPASLVRAATTCLQGEAP